MDETLVGGKDQNRHKDKRGGGQGGGIGVGDKSIVIGAVRRKGNVVARVIENVPSAKLTAFVNEAVSNKVSLLCTDAWSSYRKIVEEGYRHGVVDHRKGQYVVGAVHTQTIEGFWSLVKRGVVGTFHKVSKNACRSTQRNSNSATIIVKNPDIFGGRDSSPLRRTKWRSPQ